VAAGHGRGPLAVGPPLFSGAEAALYLVPWGRGEALAKIRVPKPYRHPALDEELRWKRTVTEARAVREALEAGVPVPAVYLVDPPSYTIVMEYIRGALKLADIIEESPGLATRLVAELGSHAARLHAAGLAHGDLTTSNVLVHGTTLFLIDFGLADLNAGLREKAVDLHLFLRSLESTHPEVAEKMLSAFLEGYRGVAGADAVEELLAEVEEIRLMGRYREERRTAWRGQ